MPVPEATVNHHHGAVTGQYEVRPARQGGRMQTKAQSRRMQTTAQLNLGFCVLAANAAHIEPALFGGEHIHFQETPCTVASATICRSVEAISGTVIAGRKVTAPKRNPA